MSFKTNAVPTDFPLFEAWYGQIPHFKEYSIDTYGYSFKCWDRAKVMYYRSGFRAWNAVKINWVYHPARGPEDMAKALADTSWCLKIKSLRADLRPAEMREWFAYNHKLNDVWEYRTMPKGAKFLKNAYSS
eukprot:Platyproteum_vivax@DN4379_c0_g1_i1.p1